MPQSSTDSCVHRALSTKRRKRQSAFRIKTGCLVALRYQPSDGNDAAEADDMSIPNTSSVPVVETWINPIPGYHQGFVLIGRRIRCCFPKSVLSEGTCDTRIFEGDIVGLVDFEEHSKWLTNAIRQRTPAFIPVELLIDNHLRVPFVERMDHDIRDSDLNDEERKRHRYEEIIRGKNKSIVRVNLGIVFAANSSTVAGYAETTLVCKWVIREQVATSKTLQGKGEQKRKIIVQKQYVGNCYDSLAQQEQNWRWLASRKGIHDLEKHFVGKVVSVIPTKGASLATVVLKRMCLPEHTARGRLANQNVFQMYEDYHAKEIRVPVEQLVIVSRKIECGPENNSGVAIASRIYRNDRHSWCNKSAESLLNGRTDALVCHRCGVEGSEMLKDHIAVTLSAISCLSCLVVSKKFGKSGTFLKSCRCQPCTYRYCALLGQAYAKSIDSKSACVATKGQMCSVCCLHCKTGILCNSCGMIMHKRCDKWIRKVESQRFAMIDDDSICCRPVQIPSLVSDVLVSGSARLRSIRFSDFDLPSAYNALDETERSSDIPITGPPMSQTIRRTRNAVSPKDCNTTVVEVKNTNTKRLKAIVRLDNQDTTDCLIRMSCSRILSYDHGTRSFEGMKKHQRCATFPSREIVRNMRSVGCTSNEDKKTAVRAARATQRRMMKDVLAFGSNFLELDSLAGRESHLRFDRSGIHAWGVFADQEIREGEVVVEYRGEIIGNATAEKREKEYEEAKIGSDYMFRIDANFVCDATKRGNVARYINASCDPNCYTQIISINNTKRIVIYAKKDIQVGQELCYDYKFPVEFDATKRIPCNCRARDCRRFMNWDKRYVETAELLRQGSDRSDLCNALNASKSVESVPFSVS